MRLKCRLERQRKCFFVFVFILVLWQWSWTWKLSHLSLFSIKSLQKMWRTVLIRVRSRLQERTYCVIVWRFVEETTGLSTFSLRLSPCRDEKKRPFVFHAACSPPWNKSCIHLVRQISEDNGPASPHLDLPWVCQALLSLTVQIEKAEKGGIWLVSL